MTLLPLEEWLKYKSKKRNYFPTSDDYFNKYMLQKDRFIRLVYPHIGSGLSTFEVNGESHVFFTDHGEAHVQAVIKTAGQLVGCENRNSAINLTPYEIYLLLMSIISHDAGNIEGRENHQLRAYNLLVNNIAATLQDDPVDARIIHNIVVSHTAKGIAQPMDSHKDTIIDLPTSERAGDYDYRPRAVAALLRIADELCEDRSRLPRVIKDNARVWQGDSAPFLKYADTIDRVIIDPGQGKIEMRFSISLQQLRSRYSYMKRSGEIAQEFLIDNIKKRLSKVSAESAYCLRFLRGIAEFPNIIATMDIYTFDENENFPLTVEKIALNLHEEGYPNAENFLVNKYPNFDGLKLSEKYLIEGG